MEQRACALAVYMIENRATVRATAQKFGISKSTVHMGLTWRSGILGGLCLNKTQYIVVSGLECENDCIPGRNSL
ncbi:MAG: sporulation transcriptional regulator SpoIIID [Oscillospiraceae bacterium]|nr:sporulation transcriptional regulator SpoIIID [Oscillospiraceae bacterium]